MFDCIRFNVENVTTKYKIFAIWRLHQETPSGLHIEGACWDICNQPPINNSNVDLSRSLSSIGVSKNSPCWYVENNQHKPNYSLHFSLCSFSNVSSRSSNNWHIWPDVQALCIFIFILFFSHLLLTCQINLREYFWQILSKFKLARAKLYILDSCFVFKSGGGGCCWHRRCLHKRQSTVSFSHC